MRLPNINLVKKYLTEVWMKYKEMIRGNGMHWKHSRFIRKRSLEKHRMQKEI